MSWSLTPEEIAFKLYYATRKAPMSFWKTQPTISTVINGRFGKLIFDFNCSVQRDPAKEISCNFLANCVSIDNGIETEKKIDVEQLMNAAETAVVDYDKLLTNFFISVGR